MNVNNENSDIDYGYEKQQTGDTSILSGNQLLGISHKAKKNK